MTPAGPEMAVLGRLKLPQRRQSNRAPPLDTAWRRRREHRPIRGRKIGIAPRPAPARRRRHDRCLVESHVAISVIAQRRGKGRVAHQQQ